MRRSAGFTLIEVVVTLAVIAVLLTSIGSLIAVSVRGTHALDDHLALVESVRALEAALPDRAGLQVGTLSGETGGQRWRVDLQPFSDAQGRSPWQPLVASVAAVTPGGTTLRISTIRLRRKSP